MTISETEVESISKRLDLIASLLCLLIDPKKIPTIADQIQFLNERGLAPVEIGRVVRREGNYIHASIKNRKKVNRNAK
jgi:hypothetical protein